jgi:hypothetical protein
MQVGALAVLLAVGFAVTRHAETPTSSRTAAGATGAATADTASMPAASEASLGFARAEAAAAARPPQLKVAFQLDPTLTQSLYLGQRWVTPATFDFAQPGTAFVVRAKAQRVDSGGDPQDVDGDWATSKPEMVAIDRGPGDVTLTIREAGDSELVVQAAGERNVLRVHAEQRPDAMRVRITQQ